MSREHSTAASQFDISALAARIWTAAELRQLPREVQDAVLREQAARLVAAYRTDPAGAPARWWKAGEAARLELDQRGILLEASALIAEEEYRNNPELTAFDAFAEDDWYVDE